MKKVMSLVAAMLLVCATVSAQNAKVETIDFNKQSVQGVSLPLPGYSVDVVKGALEQRLEKGVGLKGSNSKGWRTYLAQQFSEIGSMNFDIYTMVNTIGKKKDATTVVYVLVSKGNENFANTTNDPEIMNNTKKFLDGFPKYVKEYDLNQRIIQHNNTLTKLQKEQKALETDKNKMQSQISDLEKKIATKEKDLENKNNEIQKIQESLKQLQESF